MSPASLPARLVGGIATAARRTRPSDVPLPESSVVDDAATSRCFEPVREVRRGRLDFEETGTTLAELHKALAGNRILLLGVLFGSDPLIAKFPLVGSPLDRGVFDRWFQLCWVAEAAWRSVNGDLTDPDFAPGDRELLYPLAARLRFQALSEPMRFRAAKVNPWLPDKDTRDYGRHGTIGHVFGEGSWNLLIARCREARRVWLSCLNSYQSHPLLAAARPGELEAELSWLVFAQSHGGAPLGLSVKPLNTTVALSADDRSVVEDAIDLHLLPRFRLLGVAGLALRADQRRGRVGRCVVVGIAVIAMLAAIAFAAIPRLPVTPPQLPAGTPWLHAAAVAAALCYLLIGLGSLFFGSLWTAPWLLRLPAASALGLAVLVTLPPSWWQAPRVGAAAAVLVGAGFGYLVVEARNHGVGVAAAFFRSVAVAVVGAVHGLLVSLVGLVAVAPAFIDRSTGTDLATVWRAPTSYGQAGMILMLSTCWCLAVGVFSQILWDDRPVTARLAHLNWRSERSA
jgi:hypothetical protein